MIKINFLNQLRKLNKLSFLPSDKLLTLLIIFAIIVNSYGLFSNILASNDSNFYSIVAKHIILSGDWVNLTFAGVDWLDKPHLPFWLTALSYKFFGINPFAYILPGFIFHILGAVFTYLLGRYLYDNKIGLIACLFYVSAVHLMISSIDVRAEAYLLGEITPASYFWLLYHDKSKFRWLVLGAIFSALAIMTKGVFVLITITSGVIAILFYQKKLRALFSLKWLTAFLLTFLLISPELICLYLQFDLHPEKVIFNHDNVSGIKFFFWDSQFGRFFNNGPITSGSKNASSHYLFFVHTFLWSFLPWTIFFIAALIRYIKLRPYNESNSVLIENYSRDYFLLSSFIITFILFSITRFQLDYYINILIPYASIITAKWVFDAITSKSNHYLLFHIQNTIATIIVVTVLIFSFLVLSGAEFVTIVLVCVLTISAFIVLINNRNAIKAIIYPLLSILVAFIFVTLVNNSIYIRYDAGYQIASYLAKKPFETVIDYNVNLLSLEFNYDKFYERKQTIPQLESVDMPYYLVIKDSDWDQIASKFPNARLLNKFIWIPQEKFISTLLNVKKRDAATITLLLLEVKPIPLFATNFIGY